MNKIRQIFMLYDVYGLLLLRRDLGPVVQM